MLWRDMRGRTKEIHKELQDLDSLCSSHLEERWICGNIYLDPLSLFPQNMRESWEEWRRKGKLLKVNNGGERIPKRGWLKEEEGVFIPPPKM
jgi:hypothetical protein